MKKVECTSFPALKMNDKAISKMHRTKTGILYSNLGQFRLSEVQAEPPPPLVLGSPDSTVEAWRGLVVPMPWFDPKKKQVVVFVLNAHFVLKGWNVVGVSTENETICRPRDVLRSVLVAAGHGFIVAHNHPSGDPSPSRADREITKRLQDCADLLQVRLIDHVVIGTNPPSFSFREAGLM